MKKMASISEISDIRFGYYAEPLQTGDIIYLQARHFDNLGRLLNEPDEYIKESKKAEGHKLKEGDVLFVGKGNKLFSCCYKANGQPAIASSIFFILRPDTRLIEPGYLSAILNAPQTKNVFQQIGNGTNIFSIRKSELGAFQIPLLPLKEQKVIANLVALQEKELQLAQELIAQKQHFNTAIISTLIK